MFGRHSLKHFFEQKILKNEKNAFSGLSGIKHNDPFFLFIRIFFEVQNSEKSSLSQSFIKNKILQNYYKSLLICFVKNEQFYGIMLRSI